jgi:hypothetical protein
MSSTGREWPHGVERGHSHFPQHRVGGGRGKFLATVYEGASRGEVSAPAAEASALPLRLQGRGCYPAQ